jgi:hypothetical protein
MVASGYNSSGFLFKALGYTIPVISDFLRGITANAVILAVSVLELLIALGGVTVIIGGAFILTDHISAGRVVVYLGGGTGLIGLLISLGYTFYKLGGLDPVLAYASYWLGLGMAVVARHLAKGA